MTLVTSKMGRMNVPDIHVQRLEALRKQAVDRLRDRRAYGCPYWLSYRILFNFQSCKPHRL